MFTNWLTSNSGNKIIRCNTNNTEQSLNNATATSSVLSSLPDVVLEVGTLPESVRFLAHSTVLSMHSGYLRSAVRLDEQQFTSNNMNAPTTNNLIIYISNVTAEQFAPLLTYMYTGYLELNEENIFSVLLATHLLHMPRAMEICRAFLSRAQNDGYMSNLLLNDATTLGSIATNSYNSSKIIRPIPSKATLASYGFLQTTAAAGAPTVSQQIVFQLNTYKNLQQQTSYLQQNTNLDDSLNDNTIDRESQSGEEIIVDRSSSRGSFEQQPEITKQKLTLQEEEEILIDANSITDVEDFKTNTFTITKLEEKVIKPNTKQNACRNDKANKNKCKNRTVSCLGLQVAKAPIPAAQLEPVEATKSIIDIASCDGPVRFRRILNTAYGHKPDSYIIATERTQQSVSISFQQQMARTIRQQREENENKDTAKAKFHNTEIYVCVYCKHTFKSQYCYQKHAKRHLNPLSLNCASTAALAEPISEKDGNRNQSIESAIQSKSNVNGGKLKVAVDNILQREVCPLDMNVQYYPCKTCGSKFPSYYFVHKHRKLCHVEQETVILEERDTKQRNVKAATVKNQDIFQEGT